MSVTTENFAQDVTSNGTEESILEYIAEIIYDDIAFSSHLSIIEVTGEWTEHEAPGEWTVHSDVSWEVN